VLVFDRPATIRRPVSSLVLLACAALGASVASAQDLPTQTISDAGTIDRVVIYPTSAAVTRVIHQDLAQGLWTVRVTNLPAGVNGAQLQAKVRSGDTPNPSGPRLLGVEFEETPGMDFAGSKEGIDLAERLKEARRRLEFTRQDQAQLGARITHIDQVSTRITANATADGGTAKADPAKAIEGLAWVNAEKMRVIEASRTLAAREDAVMKEITVLEQTMVQQGSAGRTQRTAVVKIAAPQATPLDLDLTYMVPKASWAPAYSIRAAGDRSGATIEYDAMIAQRTGEEWKDVRVSLSTADPVRAAQPSEVEPVYVDIEQPMYAGVPGDSSGMVGGLEMRENKSKDRSRLRGKPGANRGPGGGGMGTGGAYGSPGEPGAADDDDGEQGAVLEQLARAASVSEAGIAASFELPRRITVPSDGTRSQRTRIASFEPDAKFVYAAQPLVTDSVFLRGDLTNASAFQLLPGTAQVFMGGDFIGETAMPSVAPKSDFKVFFGPDRAVRATREVVSKVTGAAGLFGGSIATTWNYRIKLDNGTGRDIAVELLDRRAVSRNEKVEIKIADLSSPLSKDALYAAGPQKTGILRWDISVPASARGPAALPVTWTVQATRAKDIEITALPD
jgi:hypothetical protein